MVSPFIADKAVQEQIEMAQEIALPYEKSFPETPKLENLAKLFELPKGADEKHRYLLQHAQEELVQLFQRPVTSAKNTLSEDSINNLEAGAREAHIKELAQMTEALSFFDRICENPALGKTKTILIVSEDEAGGLRIKLSDEHGLPVGRIYSDQIYSVEIVARTGQLANNDTYTPMQLNFRFLKKNLSEVGSMRVDLHNRNHGKNGDNEVQLDLQLGSAQYLNNTHKRVDSLNAASAQETKERFNILLSAFILNFADKVSENEDVVVGGPFDKNNVNKKHLAKAATRHTRGLPVQIPVEVEISPEERAAALELSERLQATTETLVELKELLTNNVSAVAIEALAEAINNASDKEGAQPEDSQAKVLSWLAGKDKIKFDNLNDVMELQERLSLLADFLKTNFAGAASDVTVWSGDYEDSIENVRDAAIEKLLDAPEAEVALNHLDKIISFMAFVPLPE